MDWFDRISIGFILALSICLVLLVNEHPEEAKANRNAQFVIRHSGNPIQQADLDKAVRLINNFLDAGNLIQAQNLIDDLIRKDPYEGTPHMLSGDLFMRKLEPIRAMREYKQAIDLNPDYLDRKTALFQGKKLKIAAAEALAEIEKQRKLSPKDESIKSEKKIIYYLYRRIAGSCG